MECNEFSTLISGHIDGENTPEEELRLQKHLSSCANCRALLADYEAISRGVAALCAEPPERLAGGVMARIRHPVRKRRFLFGGGTLVAAVIALAVVLPGLSGSKSEAPDDLPTSYADVAAPQSRSAEAQFSAADEPLLVEITDDPNLPAAQNVAPLVEQPFAMSDGNAEYYVDAAAAREIVEASEHYTVIVPGNLSEAADDASCIVRIVTPE